MSLRPCLTAPRHHPVDLFLALGWSTKFPRAMSSILNSGTDFGCAAAKPGFTPGSSDVLAIAAGPVSVLATTASSSADPKLVFDMPFKLRQARIRSGFRGLAIYSQVCGQKSCATPHPRSSTFDWVTRLGDPNLIAEGFKSQGRSFKEHYLRITHSITNLFAVRLSESGVARFYPRKNLAKTIVSN